MDNKINTLQEKAWQFWQETEHTYLAADFKYYERKAILLKTVLDSYDGRFSRVLDMGCGDGMYTRLIHGYADYTLGMDVNERLIQQATEMSEDAGLKNIHFLHGGFDSIISETNFDLTVCMVVTTCLIDFNLFEAAVKFLADKTKPNGKLFINETLSKTGVDILNEGLQYGRQYASIYREVDSFLDMFEKYQFSLQGSLVLSDDERTINAFMVFEKSL